MRRVLLGATLLALLTPGVAWAQGIHTDVALPVARGEGIWRSQLRYLRATDDPAGLGRELDSLIAPQTLVYGITPRLTAFATLPVLAHRRFDPGQANARTDSAVGDLRLLGRFMLLIDDHAPLSTRRAALLAGMKFPTGADRFGTPSYDPILGAVGTWAFDRHELDADALYTITTQRHDFEAGDHLRYDLAYRYRLWPARFGTRLAQLNGLLELNGQWSGRTRADGGLLAASGGHVVFLSPGVQLALKNLVLEASIQLPVVQDLKGPQLEADFVAVLSVRVPFDLGL